MAIMNCRRILVFGLLAVLVEQILCAPLIETDHITSRIEAADESGAIEDAPVKAITEKEGVAEYLMKYGYFRPGISKNSNRKRDELKESIKRMQRFFNLNVTGELDSKTLAVMNSKRCTLPDIITGAEYIQKRYVKNKRWRSRYLTYKVLNYPSKTSLFRDRNEIDSAINEGFNIWTKSAKISLTRSTENSANIRFGFYKGNHGDQDPLEQNSRDLAHAFSPEIGEIHFNDYCTWSKYDNDNLRQVTAHEVGHAIGLGHSSDLSAIMYPVIYYKTDFELSNDDVRGIQSLYGKR